MEKITVTPYLAGTVNHAMMVMKQRRLLTITLARVHAREWRRNRELWLEERARERLQSAHHVCRHTFVIS